MAVTVGQPLYENGLLSQTTGGILRPGGLDLTGRLLALCNLTHGACILDVGCGAGVTVEHLLEAGFVHIFGIDPSQLLLQNGIAHHSNLPLACGLGEALPLAGNQWDAILAECSLSAMPEIEAVLGEFQRLLRHGGCLALSDVYARDPTGLPALRALPLQCGLREAMTQDELVSRIKAQGFEIMAWEDHSDMLKHLAAQMIMEQGSLSEFWSCSEAVVDPMDIQIAIRKVKLGYFLLVAKKL